MPYGEYFFTVIELVVILLFALFTQYGEGINPGLVGDDEATV